MTQTTKRLITELQELPDAEQEAVAASFLEELRRRWKEKEAEAEPYSSFTYLQEANIELPPDYSETYEERLYGRGVRDNA